MIQRGFLLTGFFCRAASWRNHSTSRGGAGLLWLVAALTLAVLPAQAASITWTNASSGYWHNATNWFPNIVPGNGDAVFLTNAGTYSVTITSSVSPSLLLISAGNLVVDNYATLACASATV